MIALIRMNSGLILWAIGFGAIYGLHGIGCQAGWTSPGAGGISLHRAALIATWAAFGIAGIALWLRLKRLPHGTIADRLAAPIALIGVAATIVGGLPILMIPDCV